LHNKPKAAVHPGQKLTGPKEEEEEEEEEACGANIQASLDAGGMQRQHTCMHMHTRLVLPHLA
jgi:hypothetical protein